MSANGDDANPVFKIIVIGATIFVGAAVLSGFAGGLYTPTDVDQQEFTPEPVDDVAYVVEGSDIQQIDLQATLAGSANIEDKDGYVDVGSYDISESEDWTVAVSANLSDAEPISNATYNLIGIENGTVAVWLDDGDYLARYDAGSTHWARVDAPSPKSWTPVTLYWNQSAGTLNLTADGTSATSAADTSRSVAVSWQGQLDEYRVWESGADATTISQYHSDPVQASATSPDARIAFHDRAGDAATIYYAGTDAQLIDAGWGQGLSGPDVVAGDDYETTAVDDGVGIIPLAGGYLDGQPFAFVSAEGGDLDGPFGMLVRSLNSGIVLAATIALVIVASTAIDKLRDTRRR